MTHWTPRLVEARLAEAAAILKRLPTDQTKGHLGHLPNPAADLSRPPVCTTPAVRAPTPVSVQRMKEAVAWTRDLSTQDYEIVWARAFGIPWKAICRTVGLQRTAAHMHWTVALSRIALRLNGRRLERNASQRRVVQRARAAKR